VGGHLEGNVHTFGEYRERIDVTPSQGHRRRVRTLPVLDASFAVSGTAPTRATSASRPLLGVSNLAPLVALSRRSEMFQMFEWKALTKAALVDAHCD
jgi:hypothetical protein